MNQLCADLTTANEITAILINQYDYTMHWDTGDDIKQEDLKKNQDGLIDWLPSDPEQARDHSRLVYYPE